MNVPTRMLVLPGAPISAAPQYNGRQDALLHDMAAWMGRTKFLLENFARLLALQPETDPFLDSWDWPVTSTGTNQATAYQIKAENTVVTNVPAGTGVVAPARGVFTKGSVLNADPSGLLIFYPAGAGTVEGGASIVIPPGSVGNWFANAANVVYMR